MGIVGFIRILENAGKKDLLTFKDNYVTFDSELLHEFHNDYFDYFMERYNISRREKVKVERYLDIAQNNEDKFSDAASWIKSVVRNNRDKVKDKFEDERHEKELNDIFHTFKDLKEPEDIDKLINLVEKFINIMKREEVHERVTLNKIRSVFSGQFFGQASFLQRNRARDSLNEQKEKMKEDYINPVLENVRLNDILEKSNDIKEVSKFVEEERKKDISDEYNRFLRDEIQKKFIKNDKTLEELNKYLSNEVLRCSIWNEYRSYSEYTYSSKPDNRDFTDKVFIPLAVSNRNASNFFWNSNISFPLSNMAKLILLCTPAGMVELDNDYLGFVNMDTSIEELDDSNQRLNNLKDEDNPFEALVIDMVGEAKEKSKWKLQNILFVEFKADYSSKSSDLNYFNIPEPVARYFSNYAEKDLGEINDKQFKRYLVELILTNKTIKTLAYDHPNKNKETAVSNITNLVDAKLRDCMEGNSNAYDVLLANLAKYRLNQIKKGSERVDSNTIWHIFKLGQELNHNFVQKGSENKIEGLAYRLLNAAKSRNKKLFMDSLLRVYMASEKEVPDIFLNVMHEENIEFETLAHTFVSGFISADKNKGNNKEVEKEVN